MKPGAGRTSSIGELAELGFDPEAVLLREPGLLLDPRFLGALRRQLEREIGGEEAGVALLRMGFLHGMRDAARVVGGAFASPRGISGAGEASSLPLVIRLRASRTAEPRGGLELHGAWPEHSEASARLSLGGPTAGARCSLSAGYTSGWLSGLLETDVLAVETHCSASGDPGCRFVAREAQAWRALGRAEAEAWLDALPYDAFRRFVRSRRAGLPESGSEGLDPEAAVVHIWGPVMVIPFGGADESLRAVELIGRDSGAREVSVVVVDLGGAIVDETFGAVALEQIVATVEAWGAEALFAGVGPLSAPVVAELSHRPLLVCKDLSEAVAKAFQIAEAQRRRV